MACRLIGTKTLSEPIVWILLNGTLGIYFSEISSEIHTFSFEKVHLKMWSAKRRPFCLGLNVLMFVVLL